MIIMAGKVIGLSHDLIIHPGETLLEILQDKNMSQKELAIRSGMTEKHISSVVNGKSPISVSFAKKLEYVLGIECSFWTNLQTNYDIELSEFQEMNEISEAEIDISKNLKKVLKVFKNVISIDDNMTGATLVLYLRKLLGISNLTGIPNLVMQTAFRMTHKSIDIYVLYTWIKLCELITQNTIIDTPLDIEKLQDEIPHIKSLMQEQDINISIKKLTDIFSACGIVFRVVKNVPGAPVQGFIEKHNNGNLILCLTIRNSFADIFWFSLFHEIAHIINGDITNTSLVDYDCSESEQEQKADLYASNTLINQDDYESFVSKKDFHIGNIEQFSKQQNVPIWIVIGRLQKEKHIPFSYFAQYKPRYKWEK